MNAGDYWSLFLETGAPEMYLLFKNAIKSEESNVFDCPGTGTAGHNLQ